MKTQTTAISILLISLVISTTALGDKSTKKNTPRATVASEFNGNYVISQETKATKEIAAAIETAIADMSFVARPFARKALLEGNKATKAIGIHAKKDQVSIKFGTKVEVTTPLDGKKITWTNKDNGEQHKVFTQVKGDRLVQAFNGPNGIRINTFVLSKNKKKLTMNVTISSGKLPDDVMYSLHYKLAK
jgi:ABC-type glycerol-3-phosphate transport system substrate-binding protein